MRMGLGLGFSSSGAASWKADHALALDFEAGRYRDSTGYVADVTKLSGYSYVRSGVKSELAASAGLVSFAANVAGIVPAVGYWARASIQNVGTNSLNPTWVTVGGTGVTSAGAAQPTGGASRLISLPANGDAVGVVVTNAISAGDKRTVAVLLKGTAGEQVTLRLDRDGAGAYEVATTTVTLTADFALYSVAHTFANAQTGFRLGLVRSGDAGWASSLEAYFPEHLVGEVASPPLIPTSGTAATVGADALTVSHMIPDEDFIVWVAADIKIASTDLRFALFSDGTVNNRILLFRNSSNALSAVVTASGVAQSGGAPPAGTISTGPGAIMLRRRAGKYTVGVNINGTVTIGAEGSAASLPANGTLNVGHNLGSSQALAPIKGIYRRPGTFSSADMTKILGAAL